MFLRPAQERRRGRTTVGQEPVKVEEETREREAKRRGRQVPG